MGGTQSYVKNNPIIKRLQQFKPTHSPSTGKTQNTTPQIGLDIQPIQHSHLNQYTDDCMSHLLNESVKVNELITIAARLLYTLGRQQNFLEKIRNLVMKSRQIWRKNLTKETKFVQFTELVTQG
ncbi:hypothetical protein AVEN_1606-1 [Araneus ventricosus]|uniref:Uncharacterized protein n=1 Tax=Araneus ventricosus TaxID=182803 RepID=A0A4Y2DQ84_ARAVE|nr:hypothetical protein AVEN_1606-1 [Araneus ventricosus]